MKKKTLWLQFILLFIVSISQWEINVCHTAFRYQLLKSGPLHFIGQPYCKKGRLAKVKDGIINLTLRSYLFDQHTIYPKYFK